MCICRLRPEGHAVRLFAIRKADTGRFDDAEIDWEWSHAVDDSNNRVWINLDDEVEDDPFAWTLPSVDVDTASIIRARFKSPRAGNQCPQRHRNRLECLAGDRIYDPDVPCQSAVDSHPGHDPQFRAESW